MTLVSVRAPSDLKQGYSFQVILDGKNAIVTCPYDVKKGETIVVNAVYEEGSSSVPSVPSSKSSLNDTSDFKYGLLNCTDGDVCGSALWWNAFICHCIPVAQILNRFRWNVCAAPTKQSRFATFVTVVCLYMMLYISIGLYRIMRCNNTRNCSSLISYEFGLLGFAFATYIMILLVRVRIEFRNHYSIRGSCITDFVTMFFCSCCSVIQMLRQNQDEYKHPYEFGNLLTGLQEEKEDDDDTDIEIV